MTLPSALYSLSSTFRTTANAANAQIYVLSLVSVATIFGASTVHAATTAAPSQSEQQSADSDTTPPQPVPTPRPAPCATDEHQQFDFWLGRWDVFQAGRTEPSATNIISKLHGGCALFEDYTTIGGYSGMSSSFYDVARATWHQTWIGKDGQPLYLEGGMNNKGQMILSSANWPGHKPGDPIARITWTAGKDGSVRQFFEVSQDGGEKWSTVFDGKYVKQSVD